MTTYFLSYSRRDQAIALRLADDLIASGVSVWVDQYDIQPSQHWDRAVEAAVRGCRGFIAVLSPASVASPNVADEVSVAIDDGKLIIPVMVERCTPPLRMTRMQYIDAITNYDDALRRCLVAIRNATTEAGAVNSVLPPDVLADAERRLTGFIGPIAPHLVSRAARRADTVEALYAELSMSLYDAADRKAFLSWLSGRDPLAQATATAASPPVATIDLDEAARARLVHALTLYLGPIAPQLLKREQAQATTYDDLCQRLAARIPASGDREAFLKAATPG